MIYTILPKTDLKYDDIRDTLNTNGGSVTNVVETAFSKESKINPWAKYKPVKFNLEFPDYTTSDWWKAYNGKCGFKIGKLNPDGSTSTVTRIDDLKNAGWYYDNVEGAYPKRLGDFRDYNTEAEPFIRTNVDKDIVEVNRYTGDYYVIALDSVDPGAEITNVLKRTDFKFLQDLNYYLAAAIKVGNAWQEYRGGNIITGTNLVSIPIKNLANGLYDVVVYASTSSTPGLYGEMIPLPGDDLNKTSYKININLNINMRIVLTHVSRQLLYGTWVDIDSIPSIDESMEEVKGFKCNADGTICFKGYVERTAKGNPLTVLDSELTGTSETFDFDASIPGSLEMISNGLSKAIHNGEGKVLNRLTTPGTFVGDRSGEILIKWKYSNQARNFPLRLINGALTITYQSSDVSSSLNIKEIGGSSDFAADIPA